MRPVLLSIACALALAIAPACSSYEPLPRPDQIVPRSLQGTYAGKDRDVSVYDAVIVVHEREWRLVFLDGKLDKGKDDEETYRATRLARARLDHQTWEVVPIDGTATITSASLHIALTGAEAPEWNGDYESAADVQRRLRAASAAKYAASDGGAAPASTCQRYRDCVCGLATSATTLRGDNPFDKACSEAESLLRSAADDPAACSIGLDIHRKIAPSLGYSLPAACSN